MCEAKSAQCQAVLMHLKFVTLQNTEKFVMTTKTAKYAQTTGSKKHNKILEVKISQNCYIVSYAWNVYGYSKCSIYSDVDASTVH